MLDDAAAAAWLRDAWAAALCRSAAEDPDSHIDAVQNSRLVSVRYALVTQLLGKHADGRRDALCLQRGEPEGATGAGRWDPRSFCSTVVVPWVQSTNHVLGTSSDPYVSNPLRRSRLDDWSIPLRDRAEWERLVTILAGVQGRDDAEYTETVLRGCLASIARRYAALDVPYPVPNRVSLSQTLTGVTSFLAAASGGERPLELVRAVLTLAGEDSRPSFLREVGQEINRTAAQPILRTAWADVLRTIG